MGFAASVATIIIFIAIIIISTITYPTLVKSFKNVADAKDDRHNIQMDQVNTAIDIIDISDIGGNQLQITVTNEGTTMLHASNASVLVDGMYTNYSVSPSGFWSPQNDAVFTVSANVDQSCNKNSCGKRQIRYGTVCKLGVLTMGAETSSTHLIFFIVAMIIAAGVAGVVYTNVNAIANASHASSSTLSQQLRTDITIINDPNNVPKSGDIYTFYILNTGKSTLTTDFVSVLINGVYIPEDDIQKSIIDGGSTTTWRQEDILQIEITYAGMPNGDNSIKVISENGVYDSFEFII
jgi:flagellar protein FlaG